MKKIILGAAIVFASSMSAADDVNHGCGWGTMLWEGKSGLPSYVMASLTNGTSSNALFGMTSGTNGCQTHHPLPAYGGKSWVKTAAVGFPEDIVEDIAKGEGEALDSLAVMIGIDEMDRSYFNQLTHNNFSSIVPSSDVTGQDVMINIADLMAADARLAKYVAS